jgi:hypothetical protein
MQDEHETLRCRRGVAAALWARRGLEFLALAAIVAYAVFFYRKLLFGNRVYVFRDMYTLFLAIEHTARTLARWHWPPLWDPFSSLGRPFAADLVTAVYYPLNWCVRLLPEARGLNLSIAGHHVLAATGLFTLLRYHGVSLMAATLGALVFTFGGLMVSFDNMINGLQSATWVPWVILAFEVWCDRRRVTALVGMGVGLGAIVLGAMPEFVLFANGLIVALAIDRWRRDAQPGLRRALTAVLIANGLAVGLYAVEWVPFVEYVMHSSRMSGVRLDNAIRYSLRPLAVLAFVIPRHYVDPAGRFHETAALWEGNLNEPPWALTLYVGVSVVWLVAALARLSRFQRCWWGGIGLSCLVLALGEYLPGYVWLVEHVAPLRTIRYPEKFLFVVHVLIAVGVAVGFENALREPARFRRVAWTAGLLAAGAFVARGIVAAGSTWPMVVLGHDLRLLAWLYALVAALAVGARTRPRAAAWAFLLLAASDLYRANASLLPNVPWSALQRPPRALEVMRRRDDPLRIYSNWLGRAVVPAFPESFIQEQNLLMMQDASFYLIGNLNGPASIILNDHERLEELVESLPHERVAGVFAALNVPYVTSAKNLPYPGLRLLQSPRNTLESYVFEIEPHTARAFVPARLRPVSTPDQAIEHLRSAADPVAEVAVAADSMPAGLPATMDGTVHIATYLPERVELLAQMRTPGLVVLADTYYPGWEASVDGTAASIVRANHFVRGVYVTSGEHRILFRYAPRSYRVGAAVSALTCGALLLLVAWRARSGGRTRRTDAGRSPHRFRARWMQSRWATITDSPR